MPGYTINPTLLNATDSDPVSEQLLANLIKTSDSPFFPRGYYQVTLNEKPVSIYLTHSLLLRHRENNHAESRIEVLKNMSPIKGGFSYLYKCLGILAPEDHYSFKRRKNERARICKIIPITQLFTPELILREGSYTKMNPVLRCKTPVLDSQQGYLVMKNAGKVDLFDLLEALDAGTITLTVRDKLHLTYTIIKAVKEQIHDLNIIHTDLKPENIIINLETMNATIIDYSFAEEMNHPKEADDVHGSLQYLAPEILYNNFRTIKADSFALGLTIAQIWGYLFDLDTTPSTSFAELYEFHLTRTWTYLFEHIPLNPSLKEKITRIFDDLTEFDPDKRKVPSDALLQWELVMHEFEQIEAEQDELKESVPKPQLQRTAVPKSPTFFAIASTSASEHTIDGTNDTKDQPQQWRRDSF
ncbi:putative protein kinase [Legionella moravica]|uniref:Serine/threonine protein kinase n=1 Tax=Legionella moravica TaxID=39962 RepID=A0A378JUE3_9GAMM|nr:protein kinase [Legionella moravica]KTD31686.1 putative protein kinase [Legionella moravica]STX62234.1 Serine/threonine protein kinase [Legionella moravica]